MPKRVTPHESTCANCGTTLKRLPLDLQTARVFCPLCTTAPNLLRACIEAQKFIANHPSLEFDRSSAVTLDILNVAILMASDAPNVPERWWYDLFRTKSEKAK